LFEVEMRVCCFFSVLLCEFVEEGFAFAGFDGVNGELRRCGRVFKVCRWY